MRFALALLIALTAFNSQAEDFSFDLQAYQKKPYEFFGHADLMTTHLQVDENAALSRLSFRDQSPQDFQRYYGELELNGLYRFDNSLISFRGLGNYQHDTLQTLNDRTIQELYWQLQPTTSWQFDIGKKAVKWGKGYAWNPVGFIERPKNPDDPEVNREGYVMLGSEWTHSLNGSIRNISGGLYALPISEAVNSDLDDSDTLLMAAKLSLLIDMTDLDFYLSRSSESKSSLGISFASNLSSNLEVHGDFVWREAVERPLLEDGVLQNRSDSEFQSLIGLRYLDSREITWILEWLHQPQAYRTDQMRTFYQLAASEDLNDLQLAQQARAAGYGLSNAGRNSLYLRASLKDWLDIVYLNAALTLFYNPEDHSSAVTPEWVYIPLKNHELRLRAGFLQGSRWSEYAEKLSDRKVELRWRWYF